MEKHIEHIANSTKITSAIFTIYIISLIFFVLVIVGTSDIRIIQKNQEIILPFIRIHIYLINFLIISPLLLILMYIYLHIYLHDLEKTKFNLRFIDKNKNTIVYPWIINFKDNPPTGSVGVFLSFFVPISLWFILPIILTAITYYIIKINKTCYLCYFDSLTLIAVILTIVFWYQHKIDFNCTVNLDENNDNFCIDTFKTGSNKSRYLNNLKNYFTNILRYKKYKLENVRIQIEYIKDKIENYKINNINLDEICSIDNLKEAVDKLLESIRDKNEFYNSKIRFCINEIVLCIDEIKSVNNNNELKCAKNYFFYYKIDKLEASLDEFITLLDELKSNRSESKLMIIFIVIIFLLHITSHIINNSPLKGSIDFLHLKVNNKVLIDMDYYNIILKFNHDSIPINTHVTDFSNSDFEYADLSSSILIHSNLNNTIFTNSKLIASDIRNSMLSNANFSYAILYEAKFQNSNLTFATFTNAKMFKVNFNNANLRDTKMKNAYLPKADLTGAILTNANLTGAILTNANLTGANLSYADLTGTDLTEAILTASILRDANLAEADLTKANIDYDELLTVRSLYKTKGLDNETKMKLMKQKKQLFDPL